MKAGNVSSCDEFLKVLRWFLNLSFVSFIFDLQQSRQNVWTGSYKDLMLTPLLETTARHSNISGVLDRKERTKPLRFILY